MAESAGNSSAKVFEQVLCDELQAIAQARALRDEESPERLVAARERPPLEDTAGNTYAQAYAAEMLGLSFSGGGIRSATFHLGVLQALSELKLLRKVDYLSTVSGGGYIGGWLTAWIHRAGSALRVEEKLARSGRGSGIEPPEIGHLRRYSNYLTPRTGLASLDTWAFAATYLRNLLLNLLILLAMLGAALMVPHLFLWALGAVEPEATPAAAVAAVSLLLTALLLRRHNFNFDQQADLEVQPGRSWLSRLLDAPFLVAAALVLAVFAACACGWSLVQGGALARGMEFLDGSEAAMVFALGGAVIGFLFAAVETTRYRRGAALLGAPIAGAVAGLLAMVWFSLVAGWSLGEPAAAARSWLLWLGVPLALVIFLLAKALHVGLTGRGLPPHRMEWWSRMGGLLLAITVVWAGIFWLALVCPYVLGEYLSPSVATWVRGSLTFGWVISTAGALLAGRSPATGTGEPGRNLELVGKLAPPVFVAGILAAIASGLHAVLAAVEDIGHASYWSQLSVVSSRPLTLVLVTVALAAAALVLSWRVDINQFSMHLLYKLRLARCYLEASRRRRLHPFTRFAPDDDLCLAELSPLNKKKPYNGPFPVINAALNLAGGEELAWQERKAAAFSFTPLYCGFEVPAAATKTSRRLADAGYRPTNEYAYSDGGVYCGTAMAISGAAASPNMGYHTSPMLAFLMTVFNVRLGWWLSNPRHQDSWNSQGPGLGLAYLLYELGASASDKRRFVYLSDGGHFENLGIYELVRRRCRYIIACDASQDAKMQFDDLGNAIRKCRTDLGVDIRINTSQLRLPGNGSCCPWHCAVGTIHYGQGLAPGTLIYLKASLTGDEPGDVTNYQALCPQFPHESTADQWFSESQFESYRALGRHVVLSAMEDVVEQTRQAALSAQGLDLEALFVAMRKRWYPPLPSGLASFTTHTVALRKQLERLHGDPNLRFLDAQFYPEWRALSAQSSSSLPEQLWLPANHEELRAGFYFCNSLIQLMEDVYLDLRLETDWQHPDNRGWMNLFKHWAWSGMFRATWAVSACTYGARFQNFARQRLGLELGEIEFRRHEGASLSRMVEVAGDQLNFLEKNLILDFESSNPECANELFVLQLKVADPIRTMEKTSLAKPSHIQFTFGFALVGERRILYFRVQDHLRRMGLARGALRELIKAEAVTGLNLMRLSEDAPEPCTESGARLFKDLFRSAWDQSS